MVVTILIVNADNAEWPIFTPCLKDLNTYAGNEFQALPARHKKEELKRLVRERIYSIAVTPRPARVVV